TEDQTTEFKEVCQLFDRTGDGLYLSHKHGDMMKALGQNPTNTEVLEVLGNPKNDEMNVDVVTTSCHAADCGQNKDEGTQDYVSGLRVFEKEGTSIIAGAEIHHVLVTLGEEMVEEEVEMLEAGHEDSNDCINYAELVWMLLNGRGHFHIMSQ
ncbi:Myosin light polypeptide 6, partial [Cricetulus griseus]